MPRGRRTPSPSPFQPAAPAVDEFAHLGAMIPDPDARKMAEIEKMAEYFEHHQYPQVGFRYVWVKGGKQYAVSVVSETFRPSEITNEEYVNGQNCYFITQYRGNTMINTNDPRLRGKVEPDPGPTVVVEGVTGKRETLTIKDFLDLVNGNRAVKQQVIG